MKNKYITLKENFDIKGLLNNNLVFSKEFEDLSYGDKRDVLYSYITKRAYANVRNFKAEEEKYYDFEKAEKIMDWFWANTDHPHPRYTFEQLAINESRYPESTFHKRVCGELTTLVITNILNY